MLVCPKTDPERENRNQLMYPIYPVPVAGSQGRNAKRSTTAAAVMRWAGYPSHGIYTVAQQASKKKKKLVHRGPHPYRFLMLRILSVGNVIMRPWALQLGKEKKKPEGEVFGRKGHTKKAARINMSTCTYLPIHSPCWSQDRVGILFIFSLILGLVQFSSGAVEPVSDVQHS